MNELAKQIKAYQTDKRYLQSEPFIFSHRYDDYKVERLVGYNIIVRLGYHMLVPEGDGEALVFAKDTAIKAINHAVFGEFREPLLELLRHDRIRNNEELRTKVNRIYNQMFALD